MTTLEQIAETEKQLNAIKAKLDAALTPDNTEEIVELKLSKGEIALVLGAIEMAME